jgi:hypothetical protein
MSTRFSEEQPDYSYKIGVGNMGVKELLESMPGDIFTFIRAQKINPNSSQYKTFGPRSMYRLKLILCVW